ncbi:MAG: alpha/beta hydrolase, partial [Planctomycetes bacterium]|nr:alpha/beta hydrolase [Planctomycetota bacterium]
MKRVKLLALAAGLALVAGCTFQPPVALNDIFLRPTEAIEGTPADYGYAYDSLFLPIAAGREISIWHVHAEKPKGIVVVIPGSDRNKSRYLIGLPVFVPAGYDVILMDYEGFGESPGANTLQNLIDDGMAAVEYAQSQHSVVIPFGISTGASAAVKAAAEQKVAGLLLEAPLILKDEPELYLSYIGIDLPFFSNVANLYTWPQIPPDFDLLAKIPNVEVAKLSMCSTEDDVVTYESGV